MIIIYNYSILLLERLAKQCQNSELTMKKSRLSQSQSLYLKQHTENTIDWWPWCNEAFEEAAKDKKVILISVGYSSCHWCHVMSHESFSSEEVGDYLNENFICIKVDREEYPDIDQYYQKTAQLMNKHGGWPLNIFLTPDKRPIFCGTYFPLKDRSNVPSFLTISKEIIKYFSQKQQDILKNAQDLESKIAMQVMPKEKVNFEGHFPSASNILKALLAYADQHNGGYGKAPRFPQFSFWEAVTEQSLEGVVPKEQFDHLLLTMERMTMGGIVDQARGGIHRYATDDQWLVPHFEKMLYDQAGLLRLLSKFSLLYPSPQIFDLIIMTLDYLALEMVHESGYFFSSQDADSEGMEGLYFCFSEIEFEDAIAQYAEELVDDIDILKKWFCITPKGNFEQQLNVLSLNYNEKNELYGEKNWTKIRTVKQALLKARKLRIPPTTDNKGLAGWNFMMVSALCDIIQYVKIDAIKQSAKNLLSRVQPNIEKEFIVLEREQKTFSIKHCTTLDLSKQYFEDYVFFMESQWRLYQLTGDQNFFLNTLSANVAIPKLFVKDNQCFTTQCDQIDVIKNIPFPSFDQSYRSALSTFYILKIKIRLMQNEHAPDLLETTIGEYLRSWALYNPLAHGEGLRALIYPELAFKKISVPRNWLQLEEFRSLMTYFSHRFFFDYKDNFERWDICHSKGCEATGTTFEEFKATMTAEHTPNQ